MGNVKSFKPANAEHCLSPQGEFARAFANKWRNKNRNTKYSHHRYYYGPA